MSANAEDISEKGIFACREPGRQAPHMTLGEGRVNATQRVGFGETPPQYYEAGAVGRCILKRGCD